MNQLRRLDDQVLLAINDFARRTPCCTVPSMGTPSMAWSCSRSCCSRGLVAARHRSSRDLAATGWAAIAMLLALALNQPLGHVFAEQRPYVAHPGLLRLASVTTDFSFPSDHSVVAGAVAVELLLAHRRLATLAALLMAFARVNIAAHYPWDVDRLRTAPGLRSVFGVPATSNGVPHRA